MLTIFAGQAGFSRLSFLSFTRLSCSNLRDDMRSYEYMRIHALTCSDM